MKQNIFYTQWRELKYPITKTILTTNMLESYINTFFSEYISLPPSTTPPLPSPLLQGGGGWG